MGTGETEAMKSRTIDMKLPTHLGSSLMVGIKAIKVFGFYDNINFYSFFQYPIKKRIMLNINYSKINKLFRSHKLGYWSLAEFCNIKRIINVLRFIDYHIVVFNRDISCGHITSVVSLDIDSHPRGIVL